MCKSVFETQHLCFAGCGKGSHYYLEVHVEYCLRKSYFDYAFLKDTITNSFQETNSPDEKVGKDDGWEEEASAAWVPAEEQDKVT